MRCVLNIIQIHIHLLSLLLKVYIGVRKLGVGIWGQLKQA